LSRIGKPILFNPLAGETLVGIIERSVRKAFTMAAQRTRIQISNVLLERGLGERILSNLDTNVFALGARTLMEHARDLAAKAFLAFKEGNRSNNWGDITISADTNNRLLIKRGK
jgi:hypothetical protein